MTGIGKTALAERVVASVMESLLPSTPLRQQGMGQQNESLPYCRFSLDDRSLTPDFANSGAALLRELGEEPTLADQKDSANLVAHILQRLHRQPCRLQIDSVEQLLRGNEQESWSEFCDPLWLDLLQKFLAGTDCPSQLILTSQDIPGDLDAIASRYPQFWYCEPLQGLTPDEQRTLLQNLGLTPTEADGELLQHIGAFYNGHPLVLQVIAEEIRQPPFRGNIRQYWDYYAAEFTSTAPATATKLDRSRLFRRRVRQRVEQTLQRLPAPACQMLCASAVFRRPVPVEFWYAMLPEGDPQAAFDTLQDRHLVEYPTTPLPRPTTLLIRQHNLIRSVAYALLKADPPTWETAERQAAHLWLNDYDPAPDAPNLETVRGYLEAFDHYCEVGDWEATRRIFWKRLETPTQQELCNQLDTWGYFRERMLLAGKHLKNARRAREHWDEGAALGTLGLAYDSLGQYEQAIDSLQQVLTIARETRDRRGEGNALGNLGLAYNRLGQYEQAIAFYQQQLTIVQEIGDRRGEGNALGSLGNAYDSLGQYEQAINLHQQQLTIAREISDRRGEGNALGNLGNAYASLGQYERAIDFHEQYLTIAREIGDRRGEGNALGNLGITYDNLGDYDQSVNYANQHLTIAREIGDKRGEGAGLRELGMALLRQKLTAKALEKLQTALSILQEVKSRNDEAKTLKNLAELHHALGEGTVAQHYCQQALALATELGIPLKAECEALQLKIQNAKLEMEKI